MMNSIRQGGQEKQEEEEGVKDGEKPGEVLNLQKRFFLRPEEGDRDEGVHQRDHEGDLKGIEILNKQEGDEQAADNGADRFEDIDLADGSGFLPAIPGIEFTAVGEEGAMGKGDGKEDEKRRIEDRDESKSFSRGGKEDAFKSPAEVDGKGKGHRKEDLEKDINLHFLFYFFHRFADDKRTGGLQDQPVGQDDAEGEFVAQERDEELPQEDDLGDDAACSHDKKRDFEGRDAHIPIHYQYLPFL